MVSFENMSKVSEELDFPTLENTEIDNSQIENKKVSIDKISHTITDTFLLDENENYHIEIALINQKNNAILPVYSLNETYKYHDEDSFTIEANNIEFEIPNASEGTYSVVSYVATSDGIRISHYEDVNFSNVNENIDDINIEYERPVGYIITIETESEIDYFEFYNTICKTAFEYGMISNDIEKFVDGNYVVVTEGSSISEGIYRIGYTLNDGETETSGYINIEYTITV